MSGRPKDLRLGALRHRSEWIKSDDGREFLIKEWRPKVKTGRVIEIEVVFIVKMPDGKTAVT